MRIGATHAETTDTCTQGMLRGPKLQFVHDVERALFQAERRVGPLKMQGRRELAVLQCQSCFDQATNPRRRIHVADVGF